MKMDKYIALNGYASRRKAYDLIGEKKVTVNGKTATYSTVYKEGDVVKIDGQVLEPVKIAPVFIAYHKPKGIICTTEKIQGNIVDAINHKGSSC
jgi:23S rRNA pseudouridine2604 synthase